MAPALPTFFLITSSTYLTPLPLYGSGGRSSRHIYAQVIDDMQNRTLTAVSDKALAKEGEKQPNKKSRAKLVGAAIAKQCLEKGIDKVVFDRAGYKYHGRISALADGAREAGLKF